MCSTHDEPISECFEKHHPKTQEEANINMLHSPCGHLVPSPSKFGIHILECPKGHKYEFSWSFEKNEWRAIYVDSN
jgi:hypothetical protein